jgi:FtsZ-binding cell division protein ZapB
MFVDELQKSHADLSAKQIEKDHKISDLEYENQLLRDSSKKYIEKSYSLEQDEMRNKIPE